MALFLMARHPSMNKSAVPLSTARGTRADRFYAAQGWTRERVDGNDVFYCLGRTEALLIGSVPVLDDNPEPNAGEPL
jgi:hypothetical protein